LSEPGHPRRHYRIGDKNEGQRYVSPQKWFDGGEETEGSWWPAWAAWLTERSGEMRAAKSRSGRALGAAPGEYVHG
jgi:polyhydroxyalkanoate synthase